MSDYTKLDRYMIEPNVLLGQYTKKSEQVLESFGHAVFTDELINQIIALKDTSQSKAIALMSSLPKRLYPTSFTLGSGPIDFQLNI